MATESMTSTIAKENEDSVLTLATRAHCQIKLRFRVLTLATESRTSTLPNKAKSKGSYLGNGEYDELNCQRKRNSVLTLATRAHCQIKLRFRVLTLATESMTSKLLNKTKT